MMRVLRAWWRVLIAVRSSLGREGGGGGVIPAGSVMVRALCDREDCGGCRDCVYMTSRSRINGGKQMHVAAVGKGGNDRKRKRHGNQVIRAGEDQLPIQIYIFTDCASLDLEVGMEVGT